MKLAWKSSGITALILTAVLALPAAADHISKGDKLLREGDTAGAVAEYKKALDSRKADVREDAIDRLARVGGQDAVGILATTLKDEDPDVVEAAAEALMLVKDPAAAPALIEALNFPLTEDKAKREIIRALGQCGGPDAAAAISANLSNPDKKVRREAAQALALIGTQADVPALEAASNDMDPEVRMAVHHALGVAKTRPAPATTTGAPAAPKAPAAADEPPPAEPKAPAAADEPPPAEPKAPAAADEPAPAEESPESSDSDGSD